MKKQFIIFLIAIVIGLLTSNTSNAKGLYMSGLGGASAVNESTITDTSGDGSKAKSSFDLGYIVAASAGYGFEIGIRTEGEISYRKADHNEVEIINDGNIGFLNGKHAEVDGHISALSFMANIFYDFDLGGDLKPYAGGGIGSATVSNDGKNVPNLQIVATDDHDHVFAYQIGAGIGYNIFQPLTILLDYRYFNSSDLKLEDAVGLAYDMELQINNVSLGLRYDF